MRKALTGLVLSIALMAATWQNSGTLQNTGDTIQQRCDQGQSQAVIEIPATTAPGPTPTPVATGTPTAGPTSTPGPFNGTIYFETATNNNGAPNPFGSPLVVTPANSSTYTNSVSAIPTSGPELKYYVTLGADQWVQARLASPGPNNGAATVKVTCTTAVAFRGGSGGGGGGGVSSIVAGTCIAATPASGPNVTVSVSGSGCTPAPQATPSPTAGSGISIAGAWPYIISSTATAAAFPWGVKQAIVYSTGKSTTVSANYGSTATSGDYLLALVSWAAFSGGTINTPSGWTLLAKDSNTNGPGVAAYGKTSAGTESGISTSQSANNAWNVTLIEFNGARTLDKTATSDSSSTNVDLYSAPSLTTPTSGSGIITLGLVEYTQGCPTAGQSLLGTLLPGDSATTWNTVAFGSNPSGYYSTVLGFWDGVIGTNSFFAPTFSWMCSSASAGAVGPVAALTLSLL